MFGTQPKRKTVERAQAATLYCEHLRSMGTHQPIRKTVPPEIPDKLYFRIGDVARLCEVPTYVLRFWETEFPQLKPNKGGTGQRLYRRRDVELALRIKSLLYDQGYTIPGARQVLKNESAARSAEPVVAAEPAASEIVATPAGPALDSGVLLRQQARLRDLREELAALLEQLSQPSVAAGSAAEPRELKPANKAEPKAQPMRPRLVLEPWPRRDAAETAGGAPGPKLKLTQRDLFFPGSPTEDEWPEPPAAS